MKTRIGLVAAILVALSATVLADKRSDAEAYSKYANAYLQGIADPLSDLRKTNFIRYFLAHVYVVLVGSHPAVGKRHQD